jgi:hypothetical protein
MMNNDNYSILKQFIVFDQPYVLYVKNVKGLIKLNIDTALCKTSTVPEMFIALARYPPFFSFDDTFT